MLKKFMQVDRPGCIKLILPPPTGILKLEPTGILKLEQSNDQVCTLPWAFANGREVWEIRGTLTWSRKLLENPELFLPHTLDRRIPS
jgi:hypothetical protein